MSQVEKLEVDLAADQKEVQEVATRQAVKQETTISKEEYERMAAELANYRAEMERNRRMVETSKKMQKHLLGKKVVPS